MLRSARNYDRNLASQMSGLYIDSEQPSENRTQQQFKEDADINTIVKRFGLTGKVPANIRMPIAGDFTEVTDFHGAMNLIRTAESEFMKLPADVRARFQNDPGQVLAFLADDRNRQEAVKLGLLNPPAEVARDGSAVVATAPPGADATN